MMKKIAIRRAFLAALAACVLGVLPVVASAGTIDSTYKYAWGDVLGWVNFGTSGGSVQVNDGGLSGYAWSENYGWINLNPTPSGVRVASSGALSGSAWGEKVGYIDFAGVSIDEGGQFHGRASGTVAGTINFDCANCTVRTDYRPFYATPAAQNEIGNTTALPPAFSPTAVMAEGPISATGTVTLKLNAFARTFKVSNYADFRDAAERPYTTVLDWNVCPDPKDTANPNCAKSSTEKKVYMRFYATPSSTQFSDVTYTVGSERRLPQGNGIFGRLITIWTELGSVLGRLVGLVLGR